MCLVYMDDVLIFGRSFNEHIKQLDCALEAIEKVGLVLNLTKCKFCTPELPYLGHVLSGEGLRSDEGNVKTISEFPRSSSVDSLRSVLGALGYYRRFMPAFARIDRPKSRLLRKNVT